jgi:carbon-monoxide dehydrogenase medium subunit
MKPSRFEYHAPTTVDAVVTLLADYDEEAKVLAGGQSLIPVLSLRLGAPAALIDINGVTELGSRRLEPDALFLGATCRHRDVEMDQQLRHRCPIIVDAASQVGHVSIRNRGTVVGSIAHADPSAEWPALALLLDATIYATGPRGKRELSAHGFFEGFLSTGLEPTELITQVRFELPPERAGSAWVEFARRHGDFALVGVGVVLETVSGTVTAARIAMTGVSSTAVRLREAESVLIGEDTGESLFTEAAQVAAASIDPRSDIHGSADYRRRLAAVLTSRALMQAAHRTMTRNDGEN